MRGQTARWRRGCWLGVWLVATLAWGHVDAAPWRAGVARVKITPAQPMWMAGYGSRTRPSEGKLTDLWAKALVFEQQPAGRAVLVTLDLLGIDRRLSMRIAARLKERYGLERNQVVFCCSHTHSGPVIADNLRPLHYLRLPADQQQLIEDYAQRLEREIVELVGRALDDLRPVTLTWGSGRATFAVNRRENRAADVAALRAQGTLKGPSDHDVPVLAVWDAEQRLRAVFFGYACHATVLSHYLWSGDYPGFAQMEIERSHDGCTALFWAGCGGDQNPLPRRTVELAKAYGDQLAKGVDAALSGTMEPIGGKLVCRYHEVELPLADLPPRADLQRDAGSENVYVATRAKMLLGEIDAGEPLAQSYPYPVATWNVGSDVRMVFLGGEVVVDYALRVKTELDGPRTWVAGYSNDV
ncbi:MAG: neutral/alkaline non-lysosomal ceramidase N-terminal domain-containing protein, partial [Pirellulales bacterium]